jgi:hypothetical protein
MSQLILVNSNMCNCNQDHLLPNSAGQTCVPPQSRRGASTPSENEMPEEQLQRLGMIGNSRKVDKTDVLLPPPHNWND